MATFQNCSRRRFLIGLGLASTLGPHAKAQSNRIEKAAVPFVDGLSFMPDLRKEPDALSESGLSSFIVDVSQAERLPTADGSIRYFRSFEACLRSITEMRRRLRRTRGAFLATRGSQIIEAFQDRRTAVFFQFQGCQPIGEDLTRIDLFYELGLRVLQITHHNDNPFGGGALEPSPVGLTALGFEGLEHMNELRIVPDVSHGSDQTALDVIRSSKSPIILSHGAARSIVPNARCAPDEVIRAIGDSGGVMGVFVLSMWLTNAPSPSVEHFVQHVRHIENVGGGEAVGIANDFPVTGNAHLASLGNDNAEGIKATLPWWESVAAQGVLGYDRIPEHYVIPELNNVRRMFTIQRALEDSGYKSAQIERIVGGNWIRVLTDVLG